MAGNESKNPDVHLSIVSHGDGEMVSQLLDDISNLPCASRLKFTVVINIPEVSGAFQDRVGFPIAIIENTEPRGFGSNHNLAFRQAILKEERKWFLVANPDVRIHEDAITPLILALERDRGLGVIGPQVRRLDGTPADSARRLPTPRRLFAKLLGIPEQWRSIVELKSFQPDWIAGMFMVFRAEVFEHIGGFDERYFLYYEDVDICSRVWLAGFSVRVDPSVSIIHKAQRKSWRNFKYLCSHLSSIAKFFSSDIYPQVKRLHSKRGTNE